MNTPPFSNIKNGYVGLKCLKRSRISVGWWSGDGGVDPSCRRLRRISDDSKLRMVQ